MKNHVILVWIVLCIAGWGEAAQAISITNLDSTKQVLVYVRDGQKMRSEIEPSHNVRLAPCRLCMAWLEGTPQESLYLHDANDYSIWPGGKLRLQMRKRVGAFRVR